MWHFLFWNILGVAYQCMMLFRSVVTPWESLGSWWIWFWWGCSRENHDSKIKQLILPKKDWSVCNDQMIPTNNWSVWEVSARLGFHMYDLDVWGWKRVFELSNRPLNYQNALSSTMTNFSVTMHLDTNDFYKINYVVSLMLVNDIFQLPLYPLSIYEMIYVLIN